MDAQKLYYLSVVIEQGSFRKAAEHLSISQPALSKAIARLEATLDAKILERTASGVSPTGVGELLYSHARVIREDIERAQHTLSQWVSSKARNRSITLGTLPTLASSIIPRAVSAWRAHDSKTTLKIVEKVQIELLLDLLRGHVDFVIGRTEYYDLIEGFRQRVLFRDRMHVFARKTHPLFSLLHVEWKDATKYPWVCTMVGRQRNILQTILEAKGLGMPEQVTECTSIDFTISLVLQSDHLAMLPFYISTVGDIRRGLAPLPLSDPRFNRDIAVIIRTACPLTPASRSLLAHIEAVGAEITQQDGA